MATFQDASVGIGVESTYGTGVTPTRWFEFVSETFDFNKNVKQGQGLRVGSRVARSARRVVPTADAGGDFTMECTSKGMGLLWQALLGTGVSTLVSGSTFQQNFTLGTGAGASSLTLQVGVPNIAAGVDAYTYLGGTADSFELSCPNGDIVSLKSSFDFKDLTTATGYASPSYASNPNLFHFANGSISTGTFTSPTATALASAATPLAIVRDFTLSVSQSTKQDRYNFGGGGRKSKPTLGLAPITGKMTVEYDNSQTAAYLADTAFTLVLTFTAGALSTGTETLQLALPECKLDPGGGIPQTNGPDLITQSLSFSALDNLSAAQPIWVVCRTADAAL